MPGPWAGWFGLGLGSLTPKVSLPFFCLLHVDVGPPVPISMPLCTTLLLHASPPISTSPPLLPIWLNVASLNSWFLEFNIAQFSDNCGWYFFCSMAVFFCYSYVWRWGMLPIPPSWLEVPYSIYLNHIYMSLNIFFYTYKAFCSLNIWEGIP